MKKWDDGWDDELWLLTPEEFAEVPPGVFLTRIDGTRAQKGVDDIGLEVRAGHIPFGFLHSEIYVTATPDVGSEPGPVV